MPHRALHHPVRDVRHRAQDLHGQAPPLHLQLPRARRHLARQLGGEGNHFPRFVEAHAPRDLRADALARRAGHPVPAVDAAARVAQAQRGLPAERALQPVRGDAQDVAAGDGGNVFFVREPKLGAELLERAAADARELAHGKRRDVRLRVFPCDLEHAVGFRAHRRESRDESVGPDPDGRDAPGFVENPRAQSLSHLPRGSAMLFLIFVEVQ